MKRSVLLAVGLIFVCSAAFAATGPFTNKIAFVTNRDGNFEIYTMSASGSTLSRLTNNAALDTHPSFSPDGAKIAFTSDRDGNNEIYVMNADGTAQTRLTIDPGDDSQPTWAPDGRRIVFQSTRAGNFDIFDMEPDGNNVFQLTNDPAADFEPAFSPAGTKIAFVSNRDGNHEIYSMIPNGSGETRLTNNTVLDTRPDFSPNGAKIAFTRTVPVSSPVNQQVVIMNADGTSTTVLTSAGANGNPAFSPDGKSILFNSTRDANVEVYSMEVNGSNQTRLTKNASSDSQPSVSGGFKVETVGVYRPTTGTWILRTQIASSAIDLLITFGGQPGDLPVSGNWNGDTRSDIGVFRDGVFHLGILKAGFSGGPFVEELPPIGFGQAGDLPVAGDWNGDGIDDVGVFRAGTFLLRQPIATPSGPIVATINFNFGAAGDLPVAGDWNGDGFETVGVYRPADGSFLLTNSHANVVDHIFFFGGPDELPLAGDFLASGRDGVGMFFSTIPLFVLSTDFSGKPNLLVTQFGQPGDLPVAGTWLP